MMPKKWLFFAVSLLVMLATAGCFDLLAIPGAAVSPGGAQVYFLAPRSTNREDLTKLALYKISMDGGQPEAITPPDAPSSITAFAVNPTNGDVVYLETDDQGVSHIMRYANGAALEFVPSSAFGAGALGSMMAYSPDGSQIALAAMLLPAGLDPNTLMSADALSPEISQAIQFRLYLVNAADGTLTPISDAQTERVNTMVWSPDGKRLAYTIWVDSNGDGIIMTVPNIDSATLSTDPGDRSQIHIYDVESGTTRAIASTQLDYSPVFTSNTTLAYATTNVMDIMTGNEEKIMVYDLSSASSQPVYTTTSLITGIALSPNGEQVAWAESGAALPTSGDSPANQVYVAGVDFQNPRPVAAIPSADGISDIPVWTPDSQSLLLSASSIISTTLKQARSNATSGKAPITPQRLIRVSVADGSQTVLYEGAMGNSSVFSALFSLNASGAMQRLAQFGAP